MVKKLVVGDLKPVMDSNPSEMGDDKNGASRWCVLSGLCEMSFDLNPVLTRDYPHHKKPPS